MSQNSLKSARTILNIEAQAIQRLRRRLGRPFLKALDLLVACSGHVVVTGMGKAGFIARKISATLASTGTPSFFLHPAEAAHGDLGMLRDEDVVIAISNSGETEEIVKVVSIVKKGGLPLIAMTSNCKSPLARHASVVLDLGINREACPLNLAPSTSTTAALAMGDALALCLSKLKGFRSEDFAELHPAGSLGRKLLKVKDIMRKGKSNPVVRVNTTVKSALLAITKARAGSCSIVDGRGKLHGIFTDGDLRRHLRLNGQAILSVPVNKVATPKPSCIHQDRLAAEAIHQLKSKKIDELPVVDEKGKVVGLLDVQDLLRAGFV